MIYIYKTQQLIMLFSRIYLAVILTPCLLAQTVDTPIYEQSNESVKKIQNEIIEKALVVREKV
ncbi:MAG: hypothetical protein ACK46A_14185, partial [Akkermansiaceae bacterium]